jgi:hypothetical protein
MVKAVKPRTGLVKLILAERHRSPHFFGCVTAQWIGLPEIHRRVARIGCQESGRVCYDFMLGFFRSQRSNLLIHQFLEETVYA